MANNLGYVTERGLGPNDESKTTIQRSPRTEKKKKFRDDRKVKNVGAKKCMRKGWPERRQRITGRSLRPRSREK
ncbi:unnamed protein product [Allacma fusca]|uniref:Uncharacterized protein n=1 Tax=Allacma fusca TaxID=39272 RepID=A0A8J2P6Z3_9HEXA|nr:unnamed protein product [Allacma fusca]